MTGENPFLIDFSWRSVVGGHRWEPARVLGDKEKRVRTYLTDGVTAGSAPGYTRYYPLSEQTALFKVFAELEIKPDTILGFANEFGMLLGDKREQILFKNSEAREVLSAGEAQSLWHNEILAMREASYLWDIIQNRDVETLALHFTWRGDHVVYNRAPDLPPSSKSPSKQFKMGIASMAGDQTTPTGHRRFEPGDLIQPALYQLQSIINERLKEETAARMLWEEGDARLVMRMVPKSLLGAMWFQFAEMIDKRQSLKQCEQCGKWFRVAGGIGRTDKKYCSQRCRTQWYRARTAEAAKLFSKGKTPAEIAKQFDTDVRTAEVWIASGRTSPKRRGSRK